MINGSYEVGVWKTLGGDRGSSPDFGMMCGMEIRP